MGFPGELVLKNMPANAGDIRKRGLSPWVGKIPWRRAWQPISIFLPGESHGRGAWWATVCRIAQSWTRLKRINTHKCDWWSMGVGIGFHQVKMAGPSQVQQWLCVEKGPPSSTANWASSSHRMHAGFHTESQLSHRYEGSSSCGAKFLAFWSKKCISATIK